MATGDDRNVITIPTETLPVKDKSGDDIEHVDPQGLNDGVRKIQEQIFRLEGRMGPIQLRDGLLLTIGGQYVTFGATNAPALSIVSTMDATGNLTNGTATIYYDTANNALYLSQNGGAYAALPTTAGSGVSISATGVISTPTVSYARVHNNANQLINTSVFTVINFNTTDFDTDNMASAANRLTFKTAGKYIVGGQILFSPIAGGSEFEADIRLNGATYIGGQGRFPESTGTNNNPVAFTTIYSFAVNDYIELIGYQNSGANINSNTSGTQFPVLWASRVGP